MIQDQDDFQASFNAGLELAARLAESWAAECGGGSGIGGEGYLNLAGSIRMRKKTIGGTRVNGNH